MGITKEKIRGFNLKMNRINYRTRFEIVNKMLNVLEERKNLGLGKTMFMQKSGEMKEK